MVNRNFSTHFKPMSQKFKRSRVRWNGHVKFCLFFVPWINSILFIHNFQRKQNVLFTFLLEMQLFELGNRQIANLSYFGTLRNIPEHKKIIIKLPWCIATRTFHGLISSCLLRGISDFGHLRYNMYLILYQLRVFILSRVST